MKFFFQNFINRSYSTFIRFLTLFIKLLFIIYITKNTSIDIFGEYGFLTSLIFFISMIIGFESGGLESRRIIGCKTKNEESSIYFRLILETLLIWLIFAILILLMGLEFNYKIILLILFTSLFESLNTEFKKILIMKNFILFSCHIDLIRVSLWSIVFIIYSYIFNSNYIDIELIFLFYFSATLLSFFLVIWKIKPIFKISYFKNLLSFFENKKNSLPFFLYGFTLLFYEIIGRFLLKYYNLEFDLGIFTFFSSFIFSISLFIWSFNVSFEHSNIMKLFNKRSYNLAFIKVYNLITKSLIIYLIISFLTALFINLLIFYFELSDYRIDSYSLFLFFMVPLISILDTHFNYFLYGLNKDNYTGIISLSSLLIFIFLFFQFDINSLIKVLELITLSFAISLIIKIITSIFLIKKNAID